MVDRITWGETNETVSAAERLGASRWIQIQLRPPQPTALPQSVEAQIKSMRISKEPMADIAMAMDAELKSANHIQDAGARQSALKAYQVAMQALQREATARSLFYDLYSANQLQERMTWFWLNHFNVQAEKRDIRAMIGDYEYNAIRPRALGKFRDLLLAAELHPAMLRYLDNDQNRLGHINENYAREILELHTLGVGSGYSQRDVEEMAKVLTGVGVNVSREEPQLTAEQRRLYVRRGVMEFNPAKHDFGGKVILGREVSGDGLAELENALDLLARQPATARHISGKLALYFIGDAPPGLVQSMTERFLATDGDIAEVLSVLFRSSEFRASLGGKLKDPMHYTLSAVRLAYEGRPIDNAGPLQYWIERLGEGLYGRSTPDGYPLEDAYWSGPGQLINVFGVAHQIAAHVPGLFNNDAGNQNPVLPQLRSSPLLTSRAPMFSAATSTTLTQARSPSEWNELMLSSPDFLHY
ncbi:DUF1800 domain-containing protein [Caulobacter sp. RL271]|uniref:DUF1800 domain-containing protein n=1 Tax=Caulobacter segnis TaxID=88688 RepID=A0ABY4ZN09_9CAUL|nr:DUF1800 domain-containing protein [Caulobacter segnis]USQ94192.1 DUF1800 domain-containing protein [Caulobacter segnis]